MDISSVDIVLRNQSGRLVVTPEGALGADAFYTLLVALAGCAGKQLVVDLTRLYPREAAMLAVREAMYGGAGRSCDIRLVDQRPGARRRIDRLRAHLGVPVYPSVESAIRTW